MTLREFWYGDEDLLVAYQKAYLRNIHYTAWVNGNYNYMSTGLAISGAFSKEKPKYPDYKDPIPENSKIGVVSQEAKAELYHKQRIKETQWFHDILTGAKNGRSTKQ